MRNDASSAGQFNFCRLDEETYRQAQRVVAAHSDNAEQCAMYLAVLGLSEAVPESIAHDESPHSRAS